MLKMAYRSSLIYTGGLEALHACRKCSLNAIAHISHIELNSIQKTEFKYLTNTKKGCCDYCNRDQSTLQYDIDQNLKGWPLFFNTASKWRLIEPTSV